jgi:hypothetical protein
MPPAHVFGPIAGKWRRLMFDKFLAMLDRNGLKVIGRG